METCRMRGWRASHSRVVKLLWLERLSAITTTSPVGVACSTSSRNRWSWSLLREGAVQVTVCPSHTRSPPSTQVLSGPRA